jgi:gluconate 2-dehydrogenase gamma chain
LTRNLTESQVATVDAIAARLIPSDETGPGAREAQVVRYIERALSTEYSGHLVAYADGLAAVDRYATLTHGKEFVRLAPEQQDAVLRALERGETGLPPASGAFFELLRRHVLEGMFGDPAWGGNAGYVGWELLGYAGPRSEWTGEEQQIEDA